MKPSRESCGRPGGAQAAAQLGLARRGQLHPAGGAGGGLLLFNALAGLEPAFAVPRSCSAWS
jgi:hypothetical protein